MSNKSSKGSKKINLSPEDISKAGENAARETNIALAENIATKTKLSAQEIQTAFPNEVDKQKLEELIEILKSETEQQKKIQALVENSERFAGVIFTLLEKIV